MTSDPRRDAIREAMRIAMDNMRASTEPAAKTLGAGGAAVVASYALGVPMDAAVISGIVTAASTGATELKPVVVSLGGWLASLRPSPHGDRRRLDAASDIAIQCADRLERGETPQPESLEPDYTGRSGVDELFEGILRAVAEDHEERKAR